MSSGGGCIVQLPLLGASGSEAGWIALLPHRLSFRQVRAAGVVKQMADNVEKVKDGEVWMHQRSLNLRST